MQKAEVGLLISAASPRRRVAEFKWAKSELDHKVSNNTIGENTPANGFGSRRLCVFAPPRYEYSDLKKVVV